MKLTYSQLSAAYEALQYLVNQKLPFKCSLLISKNYASISKEYEFYEQQERKFAMEFLVFDPTTQNIEQVSPGAFKIKEGKYEECLKAREALDNFEVDIEIRKIPISMLENIEFTPAQLAAIDFMIEEEEEHD